MIFVEFVLSKPAFLEEGNGTGKRRGGKGKRTASYERDQFLKSRQLAV